MANRLPFEIKEAVIQVCGRAFWYKGPFRSFLISANVPASLYERFSDESKYKIIRNVLDELEELGDEGYIIQRRIVTDLCNLRTVPDEAVQDRDAAVKAIKFLKKLAIEQKIFVIGERNKEKSEKETRKRRLSTLKEREKQRKELEERFKVLVMDKSNPQSRGYELEKILKELFELNEIPYRPSYKTATEQIDGCFEFKGFDYIVESRWRNIPPTVAELGSFKLKVDKKIESTRGLFISVAGFREEVIEEFTRGVTSNIVLVDGTDLMLILEDQISLIDALDLKTQKAAQEGIIYYPLSYR